MLKPDTPRFWDARYNQESYVYGLEPNPFLKSQLKHFKTGWQVLLPGDGEGRNAVWLAQHGLDVLSVDMSNVGLAKAQKLAAKKNVIIKTECVNLTKWKWPEKTFDVIVLIYLHLKPAGREFIHKKALEALKSNGLIILEAFSKRQLKYQAKYESGGPKTEEMLYSREIIVHDFQGCNFLLIDEKDITTEEGDYHSGKAAVVQAVIRKI